MSNTRVIISLFVVFYSLFASAQNKAATEEKPVKKSPVIYSNQVDASLTIHSVSFLPGVDNVSGIFSKPMDKKLHELLQNDHQWNYVDSQFVGTFFTPADLIKDPSKVIKVAKPLKVDGLVIIEIRKNPKDLLVALHLFSAKDGKLITQVTATDLDQSSTEKALEQLSGLYKQMKARIPYDGMVLSRTKNRVTMNLGQDDGVTPGQEVNAAKIIAVTRHPKLGSILQHEKALLGKIKILKVDKSLSFGDVISETENGAIAKDTKIVGARLVMHQQENWINKEYLPTEMLLSENNQVNGKVQEWRPEMPPTFGEVYASLGLSNYSQNLTIPGGNSLSADAKLYPSINLGAEIWLTPAWYLNVGMSQGTGSIDNPAPGGSPGDLNSTLSQYYLDVGYNLLLKDDFFDSKLFAALGYYSFDMSLDSNSTPGDGLPSTKYSSLRLTVGGKTPIDDDKRWYLGASFLFYINPSLKEKPVTSGADSDSKVVEFNIGLDYRMSERLWLTSALNVKTFMTDFTGTGTRTTSATSGSQKMQTLLLGVGYMF